MKTPIVAVLFSALGFALTQAPVWAQDTTSGTTSTLTLGEDPVIPENSSTLDLGPAKKVQPANAEKTANPGAGGTTRYGSWEVGCPDGEQVCVMAQVGNDKKGTPILEMHLRRLPEPQSVQGVTVIALVDIITPLGAVLTSGLTMQIDAGEEQRAPFQICTEQGCLVREPLTEEAVNRFKRGSNATLTVVAAQQGELKTVISLSGFTKAYDSMK